MSETFFDLLKDPAHWQFEIFVECVSLIIVALFMPKIQRMAARFVHRHKDCPPCDLVIEDDEIVDSDAVIDVVAAVRLRTYKYAPTRYWVCRRTEDGSHAGLAGMWEFPGGKVEPGEALEQALRREMREEFDVSVVIGRRLDVIETAMWDKRYRVHFYEVGFNTAPTLRVHDFVQWSEVNDLLTQEHLPSGTELIKRIAAAKYQQEV